MDTPDTQPPRAERSIPVSSSEPLDPSAPPGCSEPMQLGGTPTVRIGTLDPEVPMRRVCVSIVLRQVISSPHVQQKGWLTSRKEGAGEPNCTFSVKLTFPCGHYHCAQVLSFL